MIVSDHYQSWMVSIDEWHSQEPSVLKYRCVTHLADVYGQMSPMSEEAQLREPLQQQ